MCKEWQWQRSRVWTRDKEPRTRLYPVALSLSEKEQLADPDGIDAKHVWFPRHTQKLCQIWRGTNAAFPRGVQPPQRPSSRSHRLHGTHWHPYPRHCCAQWAVPSLLSTETQVTYCAEMRFKVLWGSWQTRIVYCIHLPLQNRTFQISGKK